MSTFQDAAIVTVRNTSSRLPNKAIMKIKDDIRSIDIVIERAKQTGLPVILATSTSDTDDVFEVLNAADEQVFAVTGEGILIGESIWWPIAFGDELSAIAR